MCEKIIMMSFNPSRIKYLDQESIFHNKNTTDFICTKPKHIKQSNYKTNHISFCYFLNTDLQNVT